MQNSDIIQPDSPDDVVSDKEFPPFQNWLLNEFHLTDLASGKGLDETALAKAFQYDQGRTLAKLPEVISRAQSLQIKDVASEVYLGCRIVFDE